MRPRIGISCSLGARKDEGVGRAGPTWDYVKREYYLRVEEHGGIPILLPTVRQEETLREYIRLIDGLLLTGGEDVDPSQYGEKNQSGKSEFHPERDFAEVTVLREAHAREVPVLGICRGIQLMNVCFGGSLHQDLTFRPGTQAHISSEPDVDITHPIRLKTGTRLYRLLGREEHEVNSRHHQLLNRLAVGFTISAAAPDGVVEAIERVDRVEYLVGVQWHPERMPGDPATAAVFRDFLEAAAARRARK